MNVFRPFLLTILLFTIRFEYSKGDLCTECPDNQFKYVDTDACTDRATFVIFDVSNCCSLSGFNCPTCKPGLTSVGGVCISACTDTNCNDCTGDINICKVCKDGFWKSANQCSPCPRKCATCESMSKCITCKAKKFI